MKQTDNITRPEILANRDTDIRFDMLKDSMVL